MRRRKRRWRMVDERRGRIRAFRLRSVSSLASPQTADPFYLSLFLFHTVCALSSSPSFTESPRWFVKKGQHEKAAAALARLNSSSPDSALVRSELADIQTNLDLELSHGSGTYLDCFKQGERKNLQRTLTGMALQAWQQLTGINFIFYYGTIFFQSIS